MFQQTFRRQKTGGGNNICFEPLFLNQSDCVSRGQLASLETFWFSQWGMRPGMLLNTLQFTGSPPTTKMYPAQHVNSTKDEKLHSGLKKCFHEAYEWERSQCGPRNPNLESDSLHYYRRPE